MSANGTTGVIVLDVNKAATRLAYNIPTVDRSYATASRPTGLPAGACIYDSTLKKPVWFDGSSWRDAAGTAV